MQGRGRREGGWVWGWGGGRDGKAGWGGDGGGGGVGLELAPAPSLFSGCRKVVLVMVAALFQTPNQNKQNKQNCAFYYIIISHPGTYNYHHLQLHEIHSRFRKYGPYTIVSLRGARPL